MLRRSKAISKKRDRPVPVWERHQVARRGRGAGRRGAVSVRVVGGEVGGPGLKLRDQVVGVGWAARSVTALLARFLPRETLIYRSTFKIIRRA